MMNMTALNIKEEDHLVDVRALKLTRLPDLRLVWDTDKLTTFLTMDEVLLCPSFKDESFIIYERRGKDYIYPFFESDLREKTLGDLRRDRLKEFKEVNPLVTQLYYHLKT